MLRPDMIIDPRSAWDRRRRGMLLAQDLRRCDLCPIDWPETFKGKGDVNMPHAVRSDVSRPRPFLHTSGDRVEDSRIWWVLGVVLLVAAIYWISSYQPYILPNSDFFRIKGMAEKFMGGEVPGDFKQMPLVPLLIGPVAFLLPVADNAYLHAISVLNIVLSLGILVLLYLLGREFLGNILALVPVLILLASPQFLISVHRPMLEPAIGFFSMATLVALVRRSPWAYVLAGLCALTRYEMAILLAVVFVVETYRTPRHWFRIGLKCTAAGVPFLIWFGLSVFLPAEGNPYFNEIVQASFWAVASNMVSSLPVSRPIAVAFIVLAWSVGLVAAYRQNAAVALGVVALMVLYTAAHVYYGRAMALVRYTYPVLWVTPLLTTVAFRQLFIRFWPWVENLGARGQRALALLVGVLGSLWIFRTLRIFPGQFPTTAMEPMFWYLGWSVLLVGGVGAVAFYWASGGPLRQRIMVSAVALASVSMPFILGGPVLADREARVYWEKAEYVVAAEWLAENLEDEDGVVMPLRHEVLDHMPNIDLERVTAYSEFEAETHDAFVEEMDARGIRYAAFVFRAERPTNPEAPWYARSLQNYLANKVHLMDPFREGADVAGFEKVVTLPAPHPELNHPTHVYRRTSTPLETEARNDD